MQLKIASITNLTDARYFSAIGAHYLGFCFDALNENNIPVAKAREIASWLHEPVLIGEFGIHQSKEEIEFIVGQMEVQEIQIPHNHPQKKELPFQKFLFLEDWKTLNDVNSADHLVINIQEEEINDPKLKALLASNKIFIETAFTTKNILKIITELNPYGIQITCKKEERSGLSNVDEYSEILELIGF